MHLRRAASLLIAAFLSVPAALADMKGVPNPPAFSREELALISRDARLTYAARTCPWALRRALDVWDDIQRGVRPSPLQPEPCRPPGEEASRASDEAALDILKILKEAAGQGTSR
jgi:hypothetical protein